MSNCVIFVRAPVASYQRDYIFNNPKVQGRTDAFNYNVRTLIEFFEKITKKDFYEYRIKLSELAKKTYKNANLTYFVNNDTISKGQLAWNNIADETWEYLRELPDNTYIIPIDDDDWVSPEVSLTEDVDVCMWNTLCYNSLDGTFLDSSIRKIIKERNLARHNIFCRTCGYAISSNFIKKAIIKDANHYKPILSDLLLHHGVAAKSCYEIDEKFTFNINEEKIYGCKADHLCNMSQVKERIKNIPVRDPRRNSIFVYISRKPKQAPEGGAWAQQYAEELYTINKQFLS